MFEEIMKQMGGGDMFGGMMGANNTSTNAPADGLGGASAAGADNPFLMACNQMF
jgi:hypothetical protein